MSLNLGILIVFTSYMNNIKKKKKNHCNCLAFCDGIMTFILKVTAGFSIHIVLMNMLQNIGIYELHTKEHCWIQHWLHFTRFLWRGDKCITDDHTINRSRCIISSSIIDLGI